jgi:hypothetical protein
VYAAEFDEILDAIPDEDNAAVLLEQAINGMIGASASGVPLYQFIDEPETFETDPDAAADLFQANAAAFELVHQARSRPAVAWSQRLRGLYTNPSPGPGSGQRALAKLLWFAAYYQFSQGDHAAAVETLEDLLAFGEAVDVHPTLISSLVAWSIHDLNFRFLERVGHQLDISSGQPEAGSHQTSTTPAQVRQLIGMLLDETPSHQALIESYYGNRAAEIGMAESPIPGLGLWGQVSGYVTRPIMSLEALRLAKFSTLSAQAAAEACWPDAVAHFPEVTETRSLLRSLTRPVSDTPFGSAGGSAPSGLFAYFRHLARCRMAATALAIRLFELDRGRRPATLAELVPDYIPHVPLDPFAAEPASIRYEPEADWPMLYSRGPDGRDDGGVTVRLPDGRIDRDKSDIFFYLDGKPPRGG